MHRAAFSLVELSIVLVILGLLVGGILAGQSLIRAAEVRAYGAFADQTRTATMAFRDKYFGLPGDLRNATNFWGVLAGDGANATCQNTEATGLPTCNGDGDNIITSSTLSAVAFDERFRYWQHLANAGLIAGQFTGRTDSATSGSYVITAGKNSPRLSNGNTYDVMSATSIATATVGAFPFAGTMRPGTAVIQLRSPTNTVFGLLRPEEAWNIDTKYDDGRPGYGIVNGPQSTFSSSPGCTTSDDPATATYALSSNALLCTIRFVTF